jgi:hypothetical protein
MSILLSRYGRAPLWMHAVKPFDRVASKTETLGDVICAQTPKF